ncbi:hypothetical protein SYJ56_07235 [Algoriphagus sp. D3-2-R+10]|uniref:hypothetical protein n=1 Tax=Algoriphagus aurantiacus TaxID=3103948 RepID=UPI002B3C21EF|nr:hypothetical protein [Algoriphagus sp. D3-2-R+10]MEB2775094.1 hypothetical protein [Algoriphagus sp. D3-2-R+10]
MQVISIYGGDESLNRETRFQQNNEWESPLINLKSDSRWIIEKAPNHSIWILKKELPDLKGLGSWEELQLVDGWRIALFHRENLRGA